MSKSSMPVLMIAVLSVTTFAAGLSEFIVIGLLSQIAVEFGVTMPQVGLLVTVYALGITLGTPLLTMLSLPHSARPLATFLMLLFAVLSAGSVMVSSFTVLIILRIVAGVVHGAYFSITSASLPTVITTHHTPLAIALMFSGLTLAIVLGVPVGMLAAANYGWQTPFIAISIIAGTSAILLWFVLPREFGSPTPTINRISTLYIALSNPALIKPYCFTILAFGGGFAFFSYAEPWLTEIAGLDAQIVVLIMGAVGLGALIGNILGGILPGKVGLPKALTSTIVFQIMGLVGLYYAANSISQAICLVLWSVGAFATAPMVQNWVISDKETSNARISASLNVSAFNLGMSLSSFIATRQIAADGITHLPLTAAFLVILALPFCFFRRQH
ncbi:putative Major facilitator superfamily MFS_1 [Xenorhabdus poinarii G6]|uniref:Putative Major facilitator superfamily MFS_1 n=1 Tax=Xenorhabdus poinarii G6 TaxID=1354304 RepID=A0A068R502_9GAMM|nr:MFS transporter [Xenorhabdus poinarii]CDG22243.1 putative Major facilitator superfamily MFS_1 [Xenorhabdus poinarii G6]